MRRTLSSRDTRVTPPRQRRSSRAAYVGFDAGGDGVAVERGMGPIGVVSLVDEHPDRPVDRRRIA